jgi:hypothetical protein
MPESNTAPQKIADLGVEIPEVQWFDAETLLQDAWTTCDDGVLLGWLLVSVRWVGTESPKKEVMVKLLPLFDEVIAFLVDGPKKDALTKVRASIYAYLEDAEVLSHQLGHCLHTMGALLFDVSTQEPAQRRAVLAAYNFTELAVALEKSTAANAIRGFLRYWATIQQAPHAQGVLRAKFIADKLRELFPTIL